MLLFESKLLASNYADMLARSGHYPAVTKAACAVVFEVALRSHGRASMRE